MTESRTPTLAPQAEPVASNDPGMDRKVGISDPGHAEFWSWIRKAYRDPEALDAVFSLWNMQVAYKSGWAEAAAVAVPREAGEREHSVIRGRCLITGPREDVEHLSRLIGEPEDSQDCPHAAPFRYCDGCKVSPCPIGLGEVK